ncbi:DNA polymerase zeta catalytic subunit [Gracilaria domingensis]|nr:DNA polymerase zeta catalytic subunit [Gracilaria domingensis]
MNPQEAGSHNVNVSEALISVRIVHIDYYEHPLHNYSSSTAFQAARITTNTASDRLPVIRIFGSTPAGQRTCLHIHGLRPYLYLPLPKVDPSALLTYTRELHAALEAALRAAYAPDGNPKPFIADMKPVLKHDIYGYQPGPIPFVQIFVYLPTTVQRIATIISQKALPQHLIKHHPLPYAAHVPFVLQFLSDFSLAGMDYIYLSHVRFRAPLPVAPPHTNALDHYKSPLDSRLFYEGLQENDAKVLWPFSVPKRSTCTLEIDAIPSQVMNAVPKRQEAYNFTSRTLAVLWEEERLRTGSYPERKRPRERAVKAGAHLTDDFMKERLSEILKAPADVSQQKMPSNSDGSEIIAATGDCLEEQFDDVLKYLDASGAAQTDEDDIVQFNDDPNYDDFGINAQDDLVYGDDEHDLMEEHHSVERTWADIAACTQTESLEVNIRDAPQEEQPTSTERTLTEDLRGYVPNGISIIADSHQAECKDSTVDAREVEMEESGHDAGLEKLPLKKHDAIRNQHIAKGSLSNPDIVDDVEIASFGDESEGNEHPKSLAPKAAVKSDDSRHVSNPNVNEISLRYDTETSKLYYSSEVHHVLRPSARPPKVVDADQACFASDAFRIKYKTPFYGHQDDEQNADYVFAGRRIPVRKAGSRGHLPFPSSIEKEMPTPVEVLPRIVCPVKKPPTLSELQIALVRENHDAKHSRHRGGIDIDSAGRQVRKNSVRTSLRELTYTQNNCYVGGTALEKGNLAKILNESEDSADELPSSNREDTVMSTPLEEQRNSLEFNRPPSPKYDEAYQFTVQRQYHSTERREYPNRTSSDIAGRSDDPRLDSEKRNRTASASQSPHMHQNLTVMAIEVLASSYGDKLPDPARNNILAVCTVTKTDVVSRARGHEAVTFVLNRSKALDPFHPIHSCDSEVSLFDELARHIRTCDPDVLVGFETQNSSIGYILERAQAIGHAFPNLASRWLKESLYSRNPEQKVDNPAAAYYRRKGADIKITGRHVISLWRVVRKQVKLPAYSKEVVAAELFNTTFPRHDNKYLEEWFSSDSQFCRAVSHLSRLVYIDVAIVDKLNVLSRTGELARVFGIDFMSVLTRGSQYRVESMMRRVAIARDFVLLAAPKEEVFKQPAVEALPLVMEPQSALYVDPVIVLDFQSLYPSVIIAHNLCFSTMLGNINRISTWVERRRIGVQPNYEPPAESDLPTPPSQGVFIASNGEMFVQSSTRRGILPQLLEEILETRVMVKTAMKGTKDEAIINLLNARQFGLKMIANVTYGYTSASFSGRMPCAGLADAIVQCGRDCLEDVTRYVEEELREQTGATVVYGDTDSVFVQVPGATRDEAFQIGRKIVDYVENKYPNPITLKLEKVYQPCVLQTKKRYVGYSYESPEQAVPVFDAKGIETVRRDSCPLVQKALEKSIRMLFETKNVSLVKKYVQRLCRRLHQGRIPLADYIFRKEVRLGSYKEGHLPPAAIVATKAIERDPRAVPRHGERVPFIVIYERPGAPLKDCVISPVDYVSSFRQGSVRINTTYYITKQLLPVLNRVFSLIGVRVAMWYADMPRPSFEWALPVDQEDKKKLRENQSNLAMFYGTEKCAICHGKGNGKKLCDACSANESGLQASRFVIENRIRQSELEHSNLVRMCLQCIGFQPLGRREIMCANLTCNVHNEISVTERKLRSLRALANHRQSWKAER